MRAIFQNRLLIVFVFAAFALSGCDLFNSDDETPTSPLLANVIVSGSTSQQASQAGFAEYLGQIVNVGSVTATTVRVSVNIRDNNSNLIDVASSIAVPADLAPNETGTFKVTSTTPVAQAITFEVIIEWN